MERPSRAATITLTNDANGTSLTAQTTDSGSYTFDLIQVGSYTVLVEKQGFKKFQSAHNVANVNQPLTVNATLKKNKLFFFTNLQLLRAYDTALVTRTVYTPQARAGLYRYVVGRANAPAGTSTAAVNSSGGTILPAPQQTAMDAIGILVRSCWRASETSGLTLRLARPFRRY